MKQRGMNAEQRKAGRYGLAVHKMETFKRLFNIIHSDLMLSLVYIYCFETPKAATSFFSV